MRLFVALSISTEIRENLSSLIDGLRRADAKPKWINPDHLHVTLKFIGEVATEKLSAISDALVTVRAARRIRLDFREIGFFPNERRPSVAWVGIQSAPNLRGMVAEMNSVLTPLGVPGEEKTFVPHLTIARFRETRLSPSLQTEIQHWRNRSFGTLSTGEFHLIESKLKSAGAEYTTLRSFRFVPESPESQPS